MATSTSLLDWILNLLRDPHQQAAFQADPQGYAAEHGFGDLSAADVHDALCLIADNQPASYDRDDRDYGRGGDHDAHVHYPPPRHYHHGEDAGHYLNNYITNNYKFIDERSTIIDNSVHERVDTHGGDFNENIHNDPVIASGDHAVAAGHDIRDSKITTGDGNVVGNDNHAVTGSDNTTAFGSGDATQASFDHTHFGAGSGVALGGSANGHAEHNDTTTTVHGGDGPTSVNTAGAHAHANAYDDQHTSDSSTHAAYEDHSDTDSHNDYNSHNDAHLADNHNSEIHHA